MVTVVVNGHSNPSLKPGRLVWFNGISTVVGYFMPNLVNTNILNI